jgi:translation initiation factor 3 subunit B
MNGYQIDTRHTFRINHFTDVEKYSNLDETYAEPKVEEYKPNVGTDFYCVFAITHIEYHQEHLRAWLADPQGRDQFATYRGDDVSVHWHGKPSQCEITQTRRVRAFCG